MDCYAARPASLQEENPELTRLTEFHARFNGFVGHKSLMCTSSPHSHLSESNIRYRKERTGEERAETALRTTMFTQRNKSYGLGEMTFVASSEAGYSRASVFLVRAHARVEADFGVRNFKRKSDEAT